ncbi:MAG: DUF5309 domain-containing protein [Alphaproteobacteria bacterium]|nr:DUF5309 domain-containing protein [Alphaproteobacteria bacterium]
MAIITNTALTFSSVGNREDLSDQIYNISPKETPFIAAIGKNKATATLHEWQTDSLAAAAANAQLEGDDITSFQAVAPTAKLNNRCQISYKTAIVSGTQDVVDKAGRHREIVYQLLKRSNELKRDLEFVLTNNQAPADGNSTTARQLRPLCGWYSTNKSRGASGADGTTSAAATDGTQRPLTESLVKTVLQACWTSGGNPDLIMVGPFNKTVFSGFTGNATRLDQSEDRKLISTIDVYESDFGAHKIVASRFSRERDCHILDASLWAVSYLRKMQTIDLAKTGDAEKGMVLAEYTLEARNQAGSGIVADLTTS